MSAERRRRRHAEKKLPVSKTSVTAACLGTAGVIAFFLLVQTAARTNGALTKGIVMASMASLIAVIASIVMGLREYRKEEYSLACRRAGLWLPAAALLLWGGVYLAGLFV